jgi:predicted peptidase
MIYKELYPLIILLILNSNLHSQNGELKTKVKCDYLIYTPDDYEMDTIEKFPLLIYLHGGSHKGSNLELLKGYGLPRLIEERKKFDFIIASPQCPNGTYWSRIDWFGSIYEELCKNYRIDKNRIFVTGISMGGFGAWHAAMDYPDVVDAIVPLCGGCNDSLEICKIKDIPIWTFHGVEDDSIPINETERLVKRLENCSGNIRFTKLENRGHFIQDIYENQEIYKWLLDK